MCPDDAGSDIKCGFGRHGPNGIDEIGMDRLLPTVAESALMRWKGQRPRGSAPVKAVALRATLRPRLATGQDDTYRAVVSGLLRVFAHASGAVTSPNAGEQA